MSTPANWYPDPTGRFEVRYWDGAQWTEHVHANGIQTTDPLLPAPAHPAVNEIVAATHNSPDLAPATAPGKLSRREAKRQGRDAFESTGIAAAHGDEAALEALPTTIAAAEKSYRGKALEDKKWDVLALGIRDVLDDDRLSEREEQHLFRLAAALGLDLQDLQRRDLAVFEELVIAGLNDGRLPAVDVPIMTKPGETGRATFAVSLMKEVAIRELRGGSQGVSIRIAKGVSYRTGQIRARSVVIGTQLQVQDTGVLSITNQRAVFAGNQRTLEFRFDKLVGMEQFKDGLRLNVSNRQLASLFKFTPPSSPLIAAALISHSV